MITIWFFYLIIQRNVIKRLSLPQDIRIDTIGMISQVFTRFYQVRIPNDGINKGLVLHVDDKGRPRLAKRTKEKFNMINNLRFEIVDITKKY